MCYQDLAVVCRRCGKVVKIAPLDNLRIDNQLMNYLADERHSHECLDRMVKVA